MSETLLFSLSPARVENHILLIGVNNEMITTGLIMLFISAIVTEWSNTNNVFIDKNAAVNPSEQSNQNSITSIVYLKHFNLCI